MTSSGDEKEMRTYCVGNRTYTFKTDLVSNHIEELTSICERNHKETGIYSDLAFNPDFERYVFLENANALKFMTITYDTCLVGYSAFFITEEIYQKGIISATQSATYIDKTHRGIGYPFIKFCDDILREHGINSVWRQASNKLDISPMLERAGYTFIEKSYLRRF